jgi:hypothetical protein
MGRALGPSREQNSNSRPLLKVKSNSQRAADKKKGGGKSASAQPIFRIPAWHINHARQNLRLSRFFNRSWDKR